MRRIQLISILIFAAASVLVTFGQEKKTDSDNDNLVVLVKYKSQPGKHTEAVSALNTLIMEVIKEPNFINIKMFVDPADPTNILLYEQWSDEEYYKGDHMNTPHLQKFMGEARDFLAGPPDISFWKLNVNYTND